MLRSPLPHAPACAHDAAAPSPHVPLACGPPKPRPPARLPPRPAAWLSARAGLSSERSAAACERAGCVWRCAGDIHHAVGGQRPRAHASSSCAIASSASSDTPVAGHHTGRRRAGAAHATDVHPPATAAYAIAAAAAVPPLPLQPPPPTPAAGAHAPGSTGLTALRLCHRTVRAPADVSRPLSTARRRRATSTCTPPHPSPHPFRRHVYLWARH
jgi:hypothetical protein